MAEDFQYPILDGNYLTKECWCAIQMVFNKYPDAKTDYEKRKIKVGKKAHGLTKKSIVEVERWCRKYHGPLQEAMEAIAKNPNEGVLVDKPDFPALSWNQLIHAREDSTDNYSCNNLDEAKHCLIEAVNHCFRLSIVKLADPWSLDDMDRICTAVWFFNDNWPILRKDLRKIFRQYKFKAYDGDFNNVLLLKNYQYSWHCCHDLGYHVVDLISKELPDPLPYQPSPIWPADQERLARNVSEMAVRLKQNVGEINRNTLGGWTRALENEVKAATSKGPTSPSEGEWSFPMSKREAARRITERLDTRWREVQGLFKDEWVKSSESLWLFRLDVLPTNHRKKLENPGRL